MSSIRRFISAGPPHDETRWNTQAHAWLLYIMQGSGQLVMDMAFSQSEFMVQTM